MVVGQPRGGGELGALGIPQDPGEDERQSSLDKTGSDPRELPSPCPGLPDSD